MTDQETSEAELPLETAGARLARAREAAGISRAQLAGITKIPERHLIAIETSNFAALTGRTYAVGFSRSYARAVGLDEAEIARQVRAELTAIEPEARRGLPAFEPGDPARVPSARFAWAAALAALVVILAGFAFWRSYYLPGGSLPSLIADQPPVEVISAIPAHAPIAAGAVVFTALVPDLWVKFYDAAGTQLMQKRMAQGETYTIPGDLQGVQLWTGRPDALAITVGGQAVPKLSELQQAMKDIPVSAAALLARTAPAALPAPIAVAAPAPQQRQSSAARRQVQRAAAPQRTVESPVVPAPSGTADSTAAPPAT